MKSRKISKFNELNLLNKYLLNEIFISFIQKKNHILDIHVTYDQYKHFSAISICSNDLNILDILWEHHAKIREYIKNNFSCNYFLIKLGTEIARSPIKII